VLVVEGAEAVPSLNHLELEVAGVEVVSNPSQGSLVRLLRQGMTMWLRLLEAMLLPFGRMVPDG